jgi:hypothetical protein
MMKIFCSRTTTVRRSPIATAFALPLSVIAVAAFSVLAFPAAVAAQQGFGFTEPTPPTGITVPEIIERMGKREASFAAARENYIFKQTVKVDTIDDDTGKPDGEYLQVTDITFDPTGKREEHVTYAPQNTLERVIMSPVDFDEIVHRLPFILTTEQLPDYDLTYLGREKVDELDTYVFDVKPKVLVKGRHYFQGKIWIDQQDLQIVVVNGMTVPQDTRRGHEDLQPPFTTYYQQIDGKYWFPTYTKAEGTLHFAAADGSVSQDVHMRNVVRYTDYKRFRSSVTIQYNGEDLPTKPADTPDTKPQPPK